MHKDEFTIAFPALCRNVSLQQEMINECEIRSFGAGDILMKEGGFVKFVPFVLNGLVKVYKEDGEGNETLLYYIKKGQSCIMSAKYCTNNEKSKVKAVVVSDASIILVSAAKAVEFGRTYTAWSDYLINLHGLKYDELLHMVEVLTFSKKDKRLMEYLEKVSSIGKSKRLSITHQEIANDLGSTREVISRLLKKLESEGALELRHREIILL